jgi:hypothetical protein
MAIKLYNEEYLLKIANVLRKVIPTSNKYKIRDMDQEIVIFN